MDTIYDESVRRDNIGGWVNTLEYDAETTADGLRWLRVKDGFGGPRSNARFPREDWVLDVPVLSVSVTWEKNPSFAKEPGKHWRSGGRYFTTREEAMRNELERAHETARFKLERVAKELHDLTVSNRKIQQAIKEAQA